MTTIRVPFNVTVELLTTLQSLRPDTIITLITRLSVLGIPPHEMATIIKKKFGVPLTATVNRPLYVVKDIVDTTEQRLNLTNRSIK